MCRIARHVYIWGASVHAEDWCVACPCVCCACVVFWVHSFIPSSRISTPNEREFMNAFVGKTLAICKCKKKNDKFIVVYPVLGRLCSDCTQSNAPRGERGGGEGKNTCKILSLDGGPVLECCVSGKRHIRKDWLDRVQWFAPIWTYDTCRVVGCRNEICITFEWPFFWIKSPSLFIWNWQFTS